MIEYRLRRIRRAKTLKVIISSDKRVVVTAPYRISQKMIDTFVQSRKSWIQSQLNVLPDYIYTQEHYKEYKREARKVLQGRLIHWSNIMSLEYHRLAIRNSRTRWGSCSSKRNINLSYRLLFVDKSLQDYVIIHELAHLVHMNHSPQFWSLVSQYCPDYRERRMRLQSIH